MTLSQEVFGSVSSGKNLPVFHESECVNFCSIKNEYCPQGFPGGPVVKNPPADAGDMGLISGPGRCHIPQGNATTTESVL